MKHLRAAFALPFALGLLATPVSAIELEFADGGSFGNAALDQPQVNMILRVQDTAGVASTQDPLQTDTQDLEALAEALGLDPSDLGVSATNITAYYDTGAGVGLIGGYTAGSYGVPIQNSAEFADVGIGGLETFNVSQRMTVQIASNAPGVNLASPSDYQHVFADAFTAVGDAPNRLDSQDPVDQALGDIIGQLYDFNVLGMPYFDHKQVVMDARALNEFVLSGGALDLNSNPSLATYVYEAGSAPAWTGGADAPFDAAGPGMLPDQQADFIIDMEYANFSGLTQTTGGTAPTLAHNPMIGGGLPDHLNETVDATDHSPGVTLTQGASETSGSWLFDTGAALTIASLEAANDLGIFYADGRAPGDDPANGGPMLVDAAGNAIADQWSVDVGGVGGTVTISGAIVDELILPGYFLDENGNRVEEEMILKRFPVAFADISIEDPNSPGGSYTLHGVLGVNAFLPSTFVDGAIDPTALDGLTLLPNAFDYIAFDEDLNRLSFKLTPGIVPEPTSMALMGIFAVVGLARRPRG